MKSKEKVRKKLEKQRRSLQKAKARRRANRRINSAVGKATLTAALTLSAARPGAAETSVIRRITDFRQSTRLTASGFPSFGRGVTARPDAP